MASVITISNMYEEYTCTYKVTSTTGAPGFEFDVTAFATLENWYDAGSRPEVQSESPRVETYNSKYEAPALLYYWIEYELS